MSDGIFALGQMTKRYADIVYNSSGTNSKETPEESKTGDEIVAEIIKKHGLKLQREEE